MNNIPKESRYYHLRINDMSVMQYEHLKTLPTAEWVVIGQVENEERAKGRHYHVAIKFKHAVTQSVARKRCLFDQNLHSGKYYIQPKYICSSVRDFILYCVKNGTRHVTGQPPISSIQEATEDEIQDLEDAELDAIQQDREVNMEERNARIGEREYHNREEERSNMRPPPAGAVEPHTVGHSAPRPTKLDLKRNADDSLFEKRWTAAQAGDIEWFMTNDRKFMMTAPFGKLMSNAQPDVTTNLEEKDNWFIYGEPGTGKSSSVDYLYPNCYRKIKNNEKWDSYYTQRKDHEVVYFDELDTLEELELCMGGIGGLKEKTDIYPFPIRQNYGSRQITIRPKTMIITSNFTPSQLFSMPNKYGQTMRNIETFLRAFNRRWRVMHVDKWLKLKGLVFNQIMQRIQTQLEFEAWEACMFDNSWEEANAEEEAMLSILVEVHEEVD